MKKSLTGHVSQSASLIMKFVLNKESMDAKTKKTNLQNEIGKMRTCLLFVCLGAHATNSKSILVLKGLSFLLIYTLKGQNYFGPIFQ